MENRISKTSVALFVGQFKSYFYQVAEQFAELGLKAVTCLSVL